jgi:hypothetical protein
LRSPITRSADFRRRTFCRPRPAARTCVVDTGTEVGRDINRLFCGFLRREFGGGAFRVERLDGGAARAPKMAADV